MLFDLNAKSIFKTDQTNFNTLKTPKYISNLRVKNKTSKLKDEKSLQHKVKSKILKNDEGKEYGKVPLLSEEEVKQEMVFGERDLVIGHDCCNQKSSKRDLGKTFDVDQKRQEGSFFGKAGYFRIKNIAVYEIVPN